MMGARKGPGVGTKEINYTVQNVNLFARVEGISTRNKIQFICSSKHRKTKPIAWKILEIGK